jgi:hypothetical protein
MTAHVTDRRRSASLLILFWVCVAGCCVFEFRLMECLSVLRAEEAKSEPPRITATEPVAVICGNTTTLRVRGFQLKDATELRFPQFPGIRARITEKKEAGAPKGLENKTVGDSQLTSEFVLPAEHPPGMLEFIIATPSGDAAFKLLVMMADAVIDETEPNDGFREAQKLQPGQSARGRIQADKDVDVYEFPAKAGQRLKVSVISGGPLLMDAALHCYDSHGQFLAAADDGETRDPVMMLRSSTDDTVFLCVSSAHDVGGEWNSYLLTVEEVK